ncbi:MAG: hypothetical protein QN122_12030 [Armatimonadota bacterium]|nr:hypothetical protein [Armatimonadota bacterium]
MPVDLTIVDASAFPLSRARALMAGGWVRSVRIQLAGNTEAVTARNRQELPRWRDALGQVWAWWRAGEDLRHDVEMVALARRLGAAGLAPNVEKWAEGRSLAPLAEALAGQPVTWIVGGFPAPELAGLDYQSMVALPGAQVEWQCYVGTGEGPPPREALRSLVFPETLWAAGRGPAWRYRALVGLEGARRWEWLVGMGLRAGLFWLAWSGGQAGVAAASGPDGVAAVTDESRTLMSPRNLYLGRLYGFVPYRRARVCLWHRGLSEDQVVALARQARLPRCLPRRVALFAAETASEELIRRVAEAAP